MLLYGRNQHTIVKQLSSNYIFKNSKKKKKKEEEEKKTLWDYIQT